MRFWCYLMEWTMMRYFPEHPPVDAQRCHACPPRYAARVCWALLGGHIDILRQACSARPYCEHALLGLIARLPSAHCSPYCSTYLRALLGGSTPVMGRHSSLIIKPAHNQKLINRDTDPVNGQALIIRDTDPVKEP